MLSHFVPLFVEGLGHVKIVSAKLGDSITNAKGTIATARLIEEIGLKQNVVAEHTNYVRYLFARRGGGVDQQFQDQD